MRFSFITAMKYPQTERHAPFHARRRKGGGCGISYIVMPESRKVKFFRGKKRKRNWPYRPRRAPGFSTDAAIDKRLRAVYLWPGEKVFSALLPRGCFRGFVASQCEAEHRGKFV